MNDSGNSNSMDSYSFGTLWQEITRAVGYITTSITDVFGNRDAARVNETKIRETFRTENNKMLLGVSDGTGIVYIIVLLAGVAGIVYLVGQNKKK